jgi:hypothetical protein
MILGGSAMRSVIAKATDKCGPFLRDASPTTREVPYSKLPRLSDWPLPGRKGNDSLCSSKSYSLNPYRHILPCFGNSHRSLESYSRYGSFTFFLVVRWRTSWPIGVCLLLLCMLLCLPPVVLDYIWRVLSIRRPGICIYWASFLFFSFHSPFPASPVFLVYLVWLYVQKISWCCSIFSIAVCSWFGFEVVGWTRLCV